MAKTNPILGLGIIAGGAILAANMSKDPAETTPKTTNALGFNADEETLEEAIKRVIKGDKDLIKLLKGDTGLTGAPGLPGAPGSHGVNGDSVQNYGGSLIKNGALELSTLQSWSGTNIAIATDKFEGMPVLQGSNCNNSSFIYLRTDRLYEADFYVKGSGNLSIFVTNYDLANVGAPKTDSNLGAYFKYSMAMPANFTKTVGYIGGVGTNLANVSGTTVKAKVSFLGHGGVLVSIAKLVVREVDLGKPVPYNLPWLPSGQTVYDPTTSKLGLYNGTTVVWSA